MVARVSDRYAWQFLASCLTKFDSKYVANRNVRNNVSNLKLCDTALWKCYMGWYRAWLAILSAEDAEWTDNLLISFTRQVAEVTYDVHVATLHIAPLFDAKAPVTVTAIAITVVSFHERTSRTLWVIPVIWIISDMDFKVLQ